MVHTAPGETSAEYDRPVDQTIALLSRVFLVITIAFGTALVTCLSVLPYASDTPELVDLYILVARFSLSGLIGAFIWYVPLVWRIRLAPTPGWRKALRTALSALSVLGSLTIVLVLMRIVGRGNELLAVIAERYGTLP